MTFDKYSAIIIHFRYGTRILHNIRVLWDIISRVMLSHVRFDSSRYPEEMKGEEIPLLPRIISVADVFDAMTTDRPYRNGLSFSAALDEMKAKAGGQPDSVETNAVVNAYRSPTGGPQRTHK